MSNIFFKTSSGYVDYIRRDGFTINLVNPVFSEDNFKFWSYPYEDYMTDEFKREFQNLALLNKSKTIKKIEGQLNIEGAVYNGTLEIISTDRNMVKKQIDFGSRKLNFTDFNINELNYGEIDVEDIYDYVDSVLDKTYPEINHCFPRLYTTEFSAGCSWAGQGFRTGRTVPVLVRTSVSHRIPHARGYPSRSGYCRARFPADP